MKFLDQIKIYVKAGNGGDGSPSFGGKNSLSMVGQMVEMVVKADL